MHSVRIDPAYVYTSPLNILAVMIYIGARHGRPLHVPEDHQA